MFLMSLENDKTNQRFSLWLESQSAVIIAPLIKSIERANKVLCFINKTPLISRWRDNNQKWHQWGRQNLWLSAVQDEWTCIFCDICCNGTVPRKRKLLRRIFFERFLCDLQIKAFLDFICYILFNSALKLIIRAKSRFEKLVCIEVISRLTVCSAYISPYFAWL